MLASCICCWHFRGVPLQTSLCWWNLILTTFINICVSHLYPDPSERLVRGLTKQSPLFHCPCQWQQTSDATSRQQRGSRTVTLHSLLLPAQSLMKYVLMVLELKKTTGKGSNADGIPVLMRFLMVFLAGRILQRSSSFQLILYFPYKHRALNLPHRSWYIQRRRLCG